MWPWAVGALGVVGAWAGLGSIPGAHHVPTAVDYAEFLDDFWPQLVATAIGAAAGIVGGFRIERWFDERREKERVRQAKEAQRAAAEFAREVTIRNRDILGTVVERFLDDDFVTPLATVFDTTSWEFFVRDLAPSSDLRRRLSEFHAHLRHIGALIEVLRAMALRAQTANAEDPMALLCDEITIAIRIAIPEADALLAELAALDHGGAATRRAVVGGS